MKKIISLATLLLSIGILAQNQIRVEYLVMPYYEPPTPNSGIQIEALESYFELLTDKNESRFDQIEKINNDQLADMEGTMIMGSFSITADGTYYRNFSENLTMEEMIIEHRPYILKDEVPDFKWNLGIEKKEILGFEVRKATAYTEDGSNTEITAWYAPKLNMKSGPERYCGLPGIILKLETKISNSNGSKEGTTFIATKIETLKKDKKIEKPSKGKMLTKDGYDLIMRDLKIKMQDKMPEGVNLD